MGALTTRRALFAAAPPALVALALAGGASAATSRDWPNAYSAFRAADAAYVQAVLDLDQAEDRFDAMMPEHPPALIYRWRSYQSDGNGPLHEELLDSQEDIDRAWTHGDIHPPTAAKHQAASEALMAFRAAGARAEEASGYVSARATHERASRLVKVAYTRLLRCTPPNNVAWLKTLEAMGDHGCKTSHVRRLIRTLSRELI